MGSGRLTAYSSIIVWLLTRAILQDLYFPNWPNWPRSARNSRKGSPRALGVASFRCHHLGAVPKSLGETTLKLQVNEELNFLNLVVP